MAKKPTAKKDTGKEESNVVSMEDAKTDVENDDDELIVEDPKDIFRVLYKKCLKCSYLVPWTDNVNPCLSDPECPAQKYQFDNGRDPEMLIKHMGKEFAKAMKTGDQDKFMANLKSMVKDKDMRKHIFATIAKAYADLSQIEQDAEDADVKV